MKLFITTSCCDTIKCDVDSDQQIIDIKRQINYKHPEWPVPCMKLVQHDILFHDEAKVGDYGIRDGDYSIRLVIKAVVPELHSVDPQLERWYVNPR